MVEIFPQEKKQQKRTRQDATPDDSYKQTPGGWVKLGTKGDKPVIDSHAHVAFSAYDKDREAVIERAHHACVGWVEVGTSVRQSQQAIELANRYPNVWSSVGVHPSDAESLKEKNWQRIEVLLRQPKAVAVGEVGLDFYRGGSAERQLEALNRFVQLALRYDMPVIFHVRDGPRMNAHEQLTRFLSEVRDRRLRGVIHTFSGTCRQAERYLELGMYLSFSGVVTFRNPGEVLLCTKIIQPDRMLIETDSPYLTPEPHRGTRNEPVNVQIVAEAVARLKGYSYEEVRHITEENTRRLFRIREPFIYHSHIESYARGPILGVEQRV